MQNICRRNRRRRSEGGARRHNKTNVLLSGQNAGAARLGARTPPGPDDEVRNHINEGGSWHRQNPFGCTGACCFDDRPDELMRYDAPHHRSWCVCVCVWMCAVGHNTFTPSLSKDTAGTRSRPKKGSLTASIHHVRSDSHT